MKNIVELDCTEIEAVNGAGDLAPAAASSAVIAMAAGAAAAIPSPATPAFIFVATAMGLLSIGLSLADSQLSGQ